MFFGLVLNYVGVNQSLDVESFGCLPARLSRNRRSKRCNVRTGNGLKTSGGGPRQGSS